MHGSLIGLAAVSLPSVAAWAQPPKSINDRMNGDITPVHDPCIIRDGDTYYVCCTTMDQKRQGQIPMRTSKDLATWQSIGNAFPAIPDWALKMIPETPGIWAPDLSFIDGRFCLYYALSSFGSNRSIIGLATNATLDPKSPKYKWEDKGLVFESKPGDNYNCIDPTHVVTPQGERWLAFGSFWGGIMMLRLDPRTGKPVPGDHKLINLAARPTPQGGLDTIEANYIFERNGWYYFFASYDYCCKGIFSTYYTAMGRSRSVTGPYVDKQGRKLTDGYGSVILKADQEEKEHWRGPGHCAILRDKDGRDYIVYHAYYKPDGVFQMNDEQRKKNHVGEPYLRIAPLVWSKDGWPTAIV
ncbi:MAG: arabinan endo-1,5-alpha-L-arabinosidase [Alphaproteobacteria bacterium]|nr:arabinan endo-1,5-alpha-L-arabinosidase [Alphaproteobacteria bacterium]